MINLSSQDQNCSEVSPVMCVCVTHHPNLQGRDVSKCKTPIGSESNQSVSAEELQSGTAGLGFQSWESDFGISTKRTVIYPPKTQSLLFYMIVLLHYLLKNNKTH